jgi:microcystin-dependent protein
MWSGTVDQIPAGWQLCDGTNGSPDLRDRFILGVRADENPGETGGSHQMTLTLDNMPKHKHGFTTDAAGSHSHYVDIQQDYATFWIGGLVPTNLCYPTGGIFNPWGDTEPGGSHAHTGTTDEQGKSAPFDSRPAYYRMAFIMKL